MVNSGRHCPQRKLAKLQTKEGAIIIIVHQFGRGLEKGIGKKVGKCFFPSLISTEDDRNGYYFPLSVAVERRFGT